MIDKTSCTSSNNRGGLIIVATILIVIGAVLLLSNIGIIPYALKRLILCWPMILIVVGLSGLAKRQTTGGLIVLLVGLFFWIPRLGDTFSALFDINLERFTDNWWPALLILCGIVLVIRYASPKTKTDAKSFVVPEVLSSGQVDYSYVFGGSDHVYTDPVFKGGRISVLFGGASLDLHQTTLPEGDTYLYLSETFGGIDLLIPDSWFVEIHNEFAFGGFVDNRRGRSLRSANDPCRLIIVNKGMFGGGEIK